MAIRLLLPIKKKALLVDHMGPTVDLEAQNIQ